MVRAKLLSEDEVSYLVDAIADYIMEEQPGQKMVRLAELQKIVHLSSGLPLDADFARQLRPQGVRDCVCGCDAIIIYRALAHAELQYPKGLLV